MHALLLAALGAVACSPAAAATLSCTPATAAPAEVALLLLPCCDGRPPAPAAHAHAHALGLARALHGLARPSRIPSLCTHFTRAEIEWRR